MIMMIMMISMSVEMLIVRSRSVVGNCRCLDLPLDVFINMNVNDISSISETKMASTERQFLTARRYAKRRVCGDGAVCPSVRLSVCLTQLCTEKQLHDVVCNLSRKCSVRLRRKSEFVSKIRM